MYWFTAGLIGPHLGALIGAWSYGWFFQFGDANKKEKGANEEEMETLKA